MESQAIYKLDSCKFKPEIKCVQAVCPAWENGMCSFDIAEISIKNLLKLILEAHEAWKKANPQQRIDGIVKIIKML